MTLISFIGTPQGYFKPVHAGCIVTCAYFIINITIALIFPYQIWNFGRKLPIFTYISLISYNVKSSKIN